jgi:hypothetical protein
VAEESGALATVVAHLNALQARGLIGSILAAPRCYRLARGLARTTNREAMR